MSTPGTLDRDEIGTFALTCLIGVAALGLPFLVALARVLAVGLRSKTEGPTGVVVVFGKRLVDDRPDRDYRARLETAARLTTGSSDRILILGGRTGGARVTEAEAGAQLLRDIPGSDQWRIVLEQTSRDTLTNLRNVRELLAENASREPLTLISNRYHLARVGQMASSLGLSHRLCAAEDVATALRPSSLHRWLMEGFYVAWFATGKAWARLTRNHRMLARVT
ncbi:MAG: YdcF family protein [Thiocapsa sp.]|uniref:YdcF family protein n=1 Tax=Thiocapsa sp. TaxID=2024551 RepID=UPI001BCF5EEA|nr:YdcF family protein [Thiocapsa sp.]QVL46800.1 MAG: YdcF family protein [Thiocapsa sp.]